jgi:hypothetical protein
MFNKHTLEIARKKGNAASPNEAHETESTTPSPFFLISCTSAFLKVPTAAECVDSEGHNQGRGAERNDFADGFFHSGSIGTVPSGSRRQGEASRGTFSSRPTRLNEKMFE